MQKKNIFNTKNYSRSELADLPPHCERSVRGSGRCLGSAPAPQSGCGPSLCPADSRPAPRPLLKHDLGYYVPVSARRQVLHFLRRSSSYRKHISFSQPNCWQ